MRQHLGLAMQFAVLVFLPLLIIWQLTFGFRLIVMPLALLGGIAVFALGTRLRESR